MSRKGNLDYSFLKDVRSLTLMTSAVNRETIVPRWNGGYKLRPELLGKQTFAAVSIFTVTVQSLNELKCCAYPFLKNL